MFASYGYAGAAADRIVVVVVFIVVVAFPRCEESDATDVEGIVSPFCSNELTEGEIGRCGRRAGVERVVVIVDVADPLAPEAAFGAGALMLVKRLAPDSFLGIWSKATAEK